MTDGGLEGHRIACVHLYDDYSGSAKVFANAIGELEAAGVQISVTVGSAGQTGFIRSHHRAKTVFYRQSEYRPLLLLFFMLAQALLFLRVVHSCIFWKAEVVYANTLLVPGALLAGWLCRRKVVIHLHEVGLGSRPLFVALLWTAKSLSNRLICVSHYMADVLALPHEHTVIVYNSLNREEWLKARAIASSRADFGSGPFVVAMACSLKWYKGLDSFFDLASCLTANFRKGSREIACRLLVNCSESEWNRFIRGHRLPAGVTVILRPADIYEHYRECLLVLNLSHREGWIETFGMTLLEAMACGTPVVAPVVGGCTELFRDGEGGWRIDSRAVNEIAALVRHLADDRSYWLAASNAAQENAARFGRDEFSRGIRNAIASQLGASAQNY